MTSIINNWFGIMPGVQAQMKIDSFRVQVASTIDISYEDILSIIHRDSAGSSSFNKIRIVKAVRERWNMGLREAKTIIETVAYREGLINCPTIDNKSLSILMYGDYPDNE